MDGWIKMWIVIISNGHDDGHVFCVCVCLYVSPCYEVSNFMQLSYNGHNNNNVFFLPKNFFLFSSLISFSFLYINSFHVFCFCCCCWFFRLTFFIFIFLFFPIFTRSFFSFWLNFFIRRPQKLSQSSSSSSLY